MPDRIRYYREKNGNAFWTPGKQADAFSLPRSQPLGAAGEAAMQAAITWNAKWDKRHDKTPKPVNYKPGTLGHFYALFKTKTAQTIAAPRTREDYERAWPEIEKRFGQKLISQITADDSERFHAEIHPAHNPDSNFSWNEAWRILKGWRALMNALVAYELRARAPIGRVSNPAGKGRDGLWTHDEILHLSWVAVLMGRKGSAAAIRLAWGAALSPIDVWTLERSGWRAGASGRDVATQRSKTAKRVLHALDDDTLAVVDVYLASMPAMLPNARVIRRQTGAPYANKDTFGDDFRDVRAIAFPGDERQFLDIRRSALTEARLGGATKDDIGAAAANSVDKSAALEETYLHAASTRVLEARAIGRTRGK